MLYTLLHYLANPLSQPALTPLATRNEASHHHPHHHGEAEEPNSNVRPADPVEPHVVFIPVR